MKPQEPPQRVFYVDDDQDMQRLIGHVLKPRYEVVPLSNSHSVLDSLAKSDCKVVILDIDLGTENGLCLLREIKSFDSSICVVMLTGCAKKNIASIAMRTGAEGCVFKPILDSHKLDLELQHCFAKLSRWRETFRELELAELAVN